MSLREGNRWFITLFDYLENPADPNMLYPYNDGFTDINEDGNLQYPLQYYGVHEILAFESGSAAATSGEDLHSCVMITDTLFPSTLTRGNIGENIHGRQNLGAIIWKAKLDEGIILTQDNVHHVDKGAFTTKYPIPDITNNFDQITRDFGANQT